MKDQQAAWDSEYRTHKRMWRGPGYAKDVMDHLPAGSRVLEMGCGNGKTLETLEAAGYDMVGVDFSSMALKSMSTRCPVLLADLCHLPLKGSFNGIIAYHVLENIPPDDVQRVLDGIWSLLLPGGYLFLKIFTTEDMRAGRTTRGAGITYHYYDMDLVQGFLEGYEITEIHHERRDKVYHGRNYLRSWIRAVARKP